MKYLDGKRFKESIIAAARRMRDVENYLNQINVFPVPDGDTGTNMAVTMDSIVAGAINCENHSFCEVSDAIADSAFVGARGNSGAILAQFFQGLADSTRGKINLTTKAFAEAATGAVEQARDSIANPREGTIITVMRDWANHLCACAQQTPDFVELLKEALNRAKDSLADTPNKLMELKRAGVVDAGAQGFVNLLEGMVDVIESGRIRAHAMGKMMSETVRKYSSSSDSGNIAFRFCTECLIEGENIDRKKIRELISSLGNSLIVVGSRKKVRLHIHTNEPNRILDIVSPFGFISETKIDDMNEQKEKNNMTGQAIALVVDSTCDLPPEILKRNNIHVIPLTLQVGKESYLDRVEIKTEEFYNILSTTKKKLSTSQPSPGAFKKVYESLCKFHQSIISLHISGELSGTIGGASAVSKREGYGEAIHVIDSKTSSAALGLIAMEACTLIEKGLGVKEVIKSLKLAVDSTKIYVNLPTLKYAVRSGRVTRTKGAIASLLNLKPILTVSKEGRVIEAAKAMGRKKVVKKTLDLAVQFGRKFQDPRFSVVHVMNSGLAEWYRNELCRLFNIDNVMVMNASPALGLHVGIGSTAIAVLGRPYM